MIDPAGRFERGIGDSLMPSERTVLRLWDAGEDPDAIAAAAGLDPVRVLAIVALYDDRPRPGVRSQLVASNAAFLDRLWDAYPEMFGVAA